MTNNDIITVEIYTAGAWPSGKATDFESVAHGGVNMIATTTDWLFSPNLLTIEQASYLSGWSVETMHWLIQVGNIDVDRSGQIFKDSLEEFQESLVLALNARSQ